MDSTNLERDSTSLAPGDSSGWTMYSTFRILKGFNFILIGNQATVYIENNGLWFSPFRIGFLFGS
jgi:hypothetical protein